MTRQRIVKRANPEEGHTLNAPLRSAGNLPDVIDPGRARELTDRIKVAVDGTWLLIQEAYTSRAWAALGYASWDDYCTREFGTSRLRLPREERQEVVASLREIGMSTRAIASATGHNRETVMNDLRQVAGNQPPAATAPVLYDLDDVLGEAGIDPDDLDDDTDEVQPDHFGPPPPKRPITGTDGKTYAQPARQAQPQRPALAPQFQSVTSDLSRLVARFERLQADDRYRANRDAISDRCTPELRRAVLVLQKLLSDIGQENGAPS